jgi:hypothetical protein
VPTEHAGGCACGQVRFRTRGAPDRVCLCHCLTCRKMSGSAFGAFAIFPADQVTVEGEVAAWPSSGECERCFCPRCGATLFTRCDAREIEIGLGIFDEPNVFTPTYEAWTIRREHWLATERLKGFPKNRSGSA